MNKLKNGIYLILVLLSLISCEKDENPPVSCNYQETPIDLSTANTIIPLHSQNFWVYSDSVFENGVFGLEKSTLLTIDKTYDLAGLKSLQFSSLLPRLTIRNDTMFSTEITPLESAPNCFELVYPMFFSTQDSIQVDGYPRSNKYVYRSPNEIETLVGIFTNNIIYGEEGFFEVAINEAVGIVKISFFINDINGVKIKRRILTLKDYDLN